VTTGYLPTSRPANHESGAGVPIATLPTVDGQRPPCGECPETGPLDGPITNLIAAADAVIRYRSPALRVVIADAVCLADLPARVTGLRAAGIEIIDIRLYTPCAGATPQIARFNYERALIIEHLFLAQDPHEIAELHRRYAAATRRLGLIAAGGV
jgi:hypothetical protein